MSAKSVDESLLCSKCLYRHVCIEQIIKEKVVFWYLSSTTGYIIYSVAGSRESI